MSELPKLQKVYEDLHLRGFEIVGISLDRERAELDQAIADRKITWPQTFGYHEYFHACVSLAALCHCVAIWLRR